MKSNLQLNINDVAVIGMACRLAGGNHTPEALWQSILAKRDASSEIPSWRWEPYLNRDARNPEAIKNTTKRGYFLDALEAFDPVFFGISPKEAEQMDPQQRISLEVAWEALENAGIDPRSLSGSDTAVFMGVNSDDYSKLLLEDLPNVDAWMGIGTAYCGVPNRISYHLDLMGPSTAVDAACASSLVAIHHAHQAILSGESNVALAGGVNALCGPGLTSVLDKAGATCTEGSCMSFDDGAHGYGRGEGAAVVVLKKFSSAIRDGDHIVAVLKASAVAQDGKTNGIMAPNAKAQELVARQALRQAGVEADTIQYVEAHATSTPLGDPTEVSAISAVYGFGNDGTSRIEPVAIGSVKPNVGHLEAGAGAVGFIKAILAMQKSTFPPQANLKKLNSKVDWDRSGTRVVREATEWVNPIGHPRRAAICSYGYGGTVSHAIIDEPESVINIPITTKIATGQSHERSPLLLVLSSPQEKRLARAARTLSKWLTSPAGRKEDLMAIANTLALRRAHHNARAAFVVTSHDEAADMLAAFAEGTKAKHSNPCSVSQSVVLGPGDNKGVLWVFSGHGAQWGEMGKELLNSSSVFCHAIEPLDRIVQVENGFSAIEALKEGDFVNESDRVQVMTYVIQIGLAALLRSKGIIPSAIVGHSVGEIAATVVAGSLTAEEGAIIVARRARLYASVKGQGAMFLINKPFEDVENELGHNGDVVAAIHSSPSSCVVSGILHSVMAYAEKAKSRGTKVMQIATDIAFHARQCLSPLAAPLKKELLNAGIQPRPPRVPLYSTSDMDPRCSTLRGVDYWIHNMVSPVLLTSAIRAAAADGLRLFLEVSSHPIVAHSINEILMDCESIEDEEFAVVETMRRNQPVITRIMGAVGSLYTKGADIRFNTPLGSRWCPNVPGTQWEHMSIWRKVETGGARSMDPAVTGFIHDVQRHALLGLRSPLAIDGSDMVLYTTMLDDKTKPFPGSHPLHGTEIVPAAVLVNTFRLATGAATLSNITLRVPIAISAPRDIQVLVIDENVKIVSRLRHDKDTGSDHNHSWVTHTTGRWSASMITERESVEEMMAIDIEATKRRINTVMPSNFSVDYLSKVGVSAMGFPWAVTEHYGNLTEMLAHVDVAPESPADSQLPWNTSSWAPMLDAATSVGSTIFFNDPRLRMPAHIEKVHFYTDGSPPKTGYLYVQEATQRNAGPAVHVSVCDEGGRILAKFESMRFSEIEGTPGVSGSVESLVHQLGWVPAPLSNKAVTWEKAVLVSDDENILRRYRKEVAQKLRIQDANILQLRSAAELVNDTGVTINSNTAIVYCPGSTNSLADVQDRSETFLDEVLKMVKHVVKMATTVDKKVKVFVLTAGVAKAATPSALAQAPLHGLARIIASEQPDQWGALIDIEDGEEEFPALAVKYVDNQDVIRVQDQLPRIARLHALSRELLSPRSRTLLPKSNGTYLITGGLGALGLEVAAWLVEKGARRIVLVSRRQLPPRNEWTSHTDPTTPLDAAIIRIQELEQAGATIYSLALDIGAAGAASRLQEVLVQLALPPVLGVVHAAGTLEDQLVLETTGESISRVLSPKVSGGLALDAAFPPNTLDWFVLFSSCGQLFGFPGQSSYASGNAFLDALATRRRALGDCAVAFQWTSWRGLGMAASTDFISAELESKGITDITVEEAFRAWEHLGRYDLDHGVVLRSLAFDADESLPVAILEDIAVRRSKRPSVNEGGGDDDAKTGGAESDRPTDGAQLKAWLVDKIRGIIAGVLMLSGADEVDPRAAIADLGIDSVMTVTLRKNLQSVLKVKVPPTLTWNHPTANHLAAWFVQKMAEG